MINLLITTAGGSGIYPSIEAVKSSKYKDRIKLVLVDASSIAGALYEVDRSYIVPMVDEEEFFCVLTDIIKKERINYMLSFLDEELNFLSTKLDALASLGVRTLIPDHSALMRSWNKIATFKVCGAYMPKSYILDGNLDLGAIWEEFGGAVLLKPATGRGGRDIVVPEDFEEFAFFAGRFVEKKRDYLVQKLIQGKEYNVTSLHDMHAEPLYAIPRWKFENRLIKSGSKASVIESNDAVVEFALDILKKMHLEYGFNNVEVIQNEEGIFLLEVNAGRIASQDMNIVKAGVNYIDLFIDIVDGKEIEKPTPKLGVCNIKTARDIWVEFEDIQKKVAEYEESFDRCRTSRR